MNELHSFSRLIVMVAEIEFLKEKFDENHFKIMDLGKKALKDINELLQVNPNNFQLLSLRIKLNSEWLFSDFDSILDDAYSIIENPDLTKEKMLGYNWLIKLIDSHKLPNKGINIIENQLIDIHTFFEDPSELNKEKGIALYNLAKAYYKTKNVDYAYKLLIDSYDAYPYLHSRNLSLGEWFLGLKNYEQAEKYLWAHFLWGDHSDESSMVNYGKSIWELYQSGEIDNYPNLIALMYHIIRNFSEKFGCILTKDFYKQFGKSLENDVNKFPNCSKLTVALANMYYLDLKDYDNAFKYYNLFLEGDAPNFQSYITRIYDAAEKTNNNFFKLNLNLDSNFESKNLISCYYIVLDLFEIYEQTLDGKFLQLSLRYIDKAYKSMKKFLVHGLGDAYHNIPQFFDYTCLLYGKIFTALAEQTDEITQKNQLYKNAAILHWEGYQFSNFIDNLDLAISNANKSGDTDLCIYYAQGFANDYQNSKPNLQTFKNLFCLNMAYKHQGNLIEMKFLYLKAKHLFLNCKEEDTDIIEMFSNLCYDFFSLGIDKEEDFAFLLPELEWFASNPNITEVSKDIYGAALYFIGICQAKNDNDLKAKSYFEKAIILLGQQNEEDFVSLYKNALLAYKSL